jgi:hypothetical protein
MKKNMGVFDKAIRILIALVIVVLYFTNVISGTLGVVLLVVAGVVVFTSIIGWCPIYIPFKLSTRNK